MMSASGGSIWTKMKGVQVVKRVGEYGPDPDSRMTA